MTFVTRLVCKRQDLGTCRHIRGNRQVALLPRHQLEQLLPQLALGETRPLFVWQPAAIGQSWMGSSSLRNRCSPTGSMALSVKAGAINVVLEHSCMGTALPASPLRRLCRGWGSCGRGRGLPRLVRLVLRDELGHRRCELLCHQAPLHQNLSNRSAL